MICFMDATNPHVKEIVRICIIFCSSFAGGFDTLQSKATDTSKTFIVPKVFTFENSDWFCLKAHYLPFIHAKFHSSGLSGLASMWIWVKMWFTPCEISENIDKLTSLALNQCYFVTNQSKMTRLVLKVRY